MRSVRAIYRERSDPFSDRHSESATATPPYVDVAASTKATPPYLDATATGVQEIRSAGSSNCTSNDHAFPFASTAATPRYLRANDSQRGLPWGDSNRSSGDQEDRKVLSSVLRNDRALPSTTATPPCLAATATGVQETRRTGRSYQAYFGTTEPCLQRQPHRRALGERQPPRRTLGRR